MQAPSSTNNRPTLRHSGDERYAILPENIEDSHDQHQAEHDRNKFELARLTKANSEQSERLEKLKKQNEAYERRVRELNKNSAAEQAELKELRAKLRMCEHERSQLANKQAESGDAKRREDAKERDRRVAELERTVATERRKREMLESCLDDVKKTADEEMVKLRADTNNLRQQLDAAQKDGQKARHTASTARTDAEDREEVLLTRLEQCRVALSRMAEEYGHLAATTEEHVALQVRCVRLERKLANSEGQVTELANLIRQTKEENKLLAQQLRETERENAFYSESLHQNSFDYINRPDDDIRSLENELAVLRVDITQNQGYALEALLDYHTAAHDFYYGQMNSMLCQVDDLENVAKQERTANRVLAEEVANHVALREASCAELQKTQIELAGGKPRSRSGANALEDKVIQLEQRLSEETSRHKATLQKERDVAQKLSAQLHMSKTGEEILRAEIDQCVFIFALMNCKVDRVYRRRGLLARNNLAEEEAEYLSRFNAEILGIVYVDRIRRELAENKQKLLVCTRDRDTLAAANEDLSKPASLFIRVSRPHLTSRGLNVSNTSTPLAVNATKHMILEHLPGPGDMTVDELM
ncbi:hypothetical protein BU15DRAFT_87150 [Melanogaster broomeanus]|nr:hypothetical protein BU15DRAFT_87150 [Melanogaster broomeanus]